MSSLTHDNLGLVVTVVWLTWLAINLLFLFLSCRTPKR